MERGAPVLLEVLGPPCQQPAAALAGLPRACTADICRIIHIFRLRGGSGLGFPQPRLSHSLPACWSGSTMYPLSSLPAAPPRARPSCFTPTTCFKDEVTSVPALQGDTCGGQAGGALPGVTTVPRHLEKPAQPRWPFLHGRARPRSRTKPPLLAGGCRAGGLPPPQSWAVGSGRDTVPSGCHAGAASLPCTPQNQPMSARAPSGDPAGGMQD